MRTFKLIPVFAAFAALAPLTHAGELTLTISDIRTAQGQLLISVVNSENGWDDKAPPVAAQKVAATGKELVLKFDLPAGSYAVQVLHDENDNGKLDMNLMGVPTEGYGFSNNPPVMRRAHFSEAKFDVSETPTAVTVQLR
jgi:uncharacterized protein (DUF2141 family)